MKNTYKMYYECYNCDKAFPVLIPKGTLAENHRAGVCPYCGTKDGIENEKHRHHRPLSSLTSIAWALKWLSLYLVIGGGLFFILAKFL